MAFHSFIDTLIFEWIFGFGGGIFVHMRSSYDFVLFHFISKFDGWVQQSEGLSQIKAYFEKKNEQKNSMIKIELFFSKQLNFIQFKNKFTIAL